MLKEFSNSLTAVHVSLLTVPIVALFSCVRQAVFASILIFAVNLRFTVHRRTAQV